MDYKKIIASMTLEEKASLCSGRDFWHTKAVKSQKIPEIMVSDGPHGLRKQPASQDHLGNFESIKAVCFPAACATAASFDRTLLNKMGKALGAECQAENVSTILGPAVNIKRSPLCGRNFEFFSEDPLLATELSGALIKGIQSRNIGTSIKHFLANNQETRRLTESAEIDERTLREIYLAAFESAVKSAKPWTVMCSYNRINGLHVSENKTYLTDILRDEWGFDGVVMSDWGAVNDRGKALAAGLDLEMPGSYGINDREIIEAVQSGSLPEKTLDKAVERILRWIDKYETKKQKDTKWDKDADHELAGKIEEESAVLLKNEGGILPLDGNDTIAIIGKFAKAPRYQGGGSSHINSFKVTSFMDMAKGKGHEIFYADGYDTEKDEVDRTLIAKAVNAAKKSFEAAKLFFAAGKVIHAPYPFIAPAENVFRVWPGDPACVKSFAAGLKFHRSLFRFPLFAQHKEYGQSGGAHQSAYQGECSSGSVCFFRGSRVSRPLCLCRYRGGSHGGNIRLAGWLCRDFFGCLWSSGLRRAGNDYPLRGFGFARDFVGYSDRYPAQFHVAAMRIEHQVVFARGQQFPCENAPGLIHFENAVFIVQRFPVQRHYVGNVQVGPMDRSRAAGVAFLHQRYPVAFQIGGNCKANVFAAGIFRLVRSDHVGRADTAGTERVGLIPGLEETDPFYSNVPVEISAGNIESERGQTAGPVAVSARVDDR